MTNKWWQKYDPLRTKGWNHVKALPFSKHWNLKIAIQLLANDYLFFRQLIIFIFDAFLLLNACKNLFYMSLLLGTPTNQTTCEVQRKLISFTVFVAKYLVQNKSPYQTSVCPLVTLTTSVVLTYNRRKLRVYS